MSKFKTGILHCGACGDLFENTPELMSHLDSCNAARVLLLMAWQVWGDQQTVGHNVAALMVAIRKSIPLIKKYAWVIASDIDTIKRAEIHSQLCNGLGLSRKDFQPFESSEIKQIPNQEQAEIIIWNTLSQIPLKLSMIKNKGGD